MLILGYCRSREVYRILSKRYRSITSAYYRGSVGALIIYDVTKRSSFDNVFKWLDELKEHSDQNI